MAFFTRVTMAVFLLVELTRSGNGSPHEYEEPTFDLDEEPTLSLDEEPRLRLLHPRHIHQFPRNLLGRRPFHQTLKPKPTTGRRGPDASHRRPTAHPPPSAQRGTPDWRSGWPETTSQFAGLNVTTVERGALFTPSYAMYFMRGDYPISPFHDIPLFANANKYIFNMVVEVPRWTNAKMEISTKDPLNPIKQDTKNGQLRFVANVFPHHGYIWNYGAIPQTWEDPSHVDKYTGGKGDNDPIDVCEIGRRVAKRGDVLQVKVLGVVALIDEGETDWKLIAIDVNDPSAPLLNDIDDVEKLMPGYLKETVEWFRVYKIPRGNPANVIGFNGRPANRQFAHKVIAGTHWAWRALINGTASPGGISTISMTIPSARHRGSKEQALAFLRSTPNPAPPQPIANQEVNTWHYIPQQTRESAGASATTFGARSHAGGYW